MTDIEAIKTLVSQVKLHLKHINDILDVIIEECDTADLIEERAAEARDKHRIYRESVVNIEDGE